jgi:hypothetical protein
LQLDRNARARLLTKRRASRNFSVIPPETSEEWAVHALRGKESEGGDRGAAASTIIPAGGDDMVQFRI